MRRLAQSFKDSKCTMTFSGDEFYGKWTVGIRNIKKNIILGDIATKNEYVDDKVIFWFKHNDSKTILVELIAFPKTFFALKKRSHKIYGIVRQFATGPASLAKVFADAAKESVKKSETQPKIETLKSGEFNAHYENS